MLLPTMGDHILSQDTTFTKIFVGGLPYHTTDKSLKEHFEAYGDIEEAVVITDRQTGKSRGYGFVTMADAKAAERAVKDPNPIIDGRRANVNLAYIGAKPRGAGSTQGDMMLLQAGVPLSVRTGFHTLLPRQYGLPPQYLYTPSYLPPASSLTQLPHTPLTSPISQFYDLSPAAAAFAGQYANSFDPYSSLALAAAAAGSTSFPGFPGIPYSGNPYPPPSAATVPNAAAAAAAAAGSSSATLPQLSYTNQSHIQETRMH